MMQQLFGDWAYGYYVVTWYGVCDASGIGSGETATQVNLAGPTASRGFVVGVNGLGAEGAAPRRAVIFDVANCLNCL